MWTWKDKHWKSLGRGVFLPPSPFLVFIFGTRCHQPFIFTRQARPRWFPQQLFTTAALKLAGHCSGHKTGLLCERLISCHLKALEKQRCFHSPKLVLTKQVGLAVLQMLAPPVLKLPIPPVRRNSPAFVVSFMLNGILGLGQFCGDLVGFKMWFKCQKAWSAQQAGGNRILMGPASVQATAGTCGCHRRPLSPPFILSWRNRAFVRFQNVNLWFLGVETLMGEVFILLNRWSSRGQKCLKCYDWFLSTVSRVAEMTLCK